ncbi:MAG: hypothetical protein KAT05_06245 [Spirochaetes bacterium]|nr:hypothetical protein [Spirochaetota bacterium]
MEMKSDYVNSRIDKVEKYLDKIEQIFFNIEMTKAEKYIEEAKSNFYAEKYNKAKGYIDEADNIYDKYNQSKEIIEYYRERINTAIKIQSGKRLSIDDQAYEVITELFKNAENYYNNKEYTRAREYISQILLEKPYYEKARLFEVKILVETDPESFEKIFKNYYNRAKEKYNHNLYADALIEFNQLLQFGKDKEKIKKYIYECKIKLNLIKPTVSGKDKKNARTLIKNAKENYAKENYKKALEEVNQALIIWEDVPEARSLKDKLGRKLKYKRPKLTRENELKFREAENAYSKNNFKKAYQITNEILKSQDLQKVRELNKKADKKRKIL